jgi:hypothetical protein
VLTNLPGDFDAGLRIATPPGEPKEIAPSGGHSSHGEGAAYTQNSQKQEVRVSHPVFPSHTKTFSESTLETPA